MRYKWACAFVVTVSFVVAQEPSGSLVPEEAWRHIGENKTVCGQIVDTSYATSVTNLPTYLYLERPRPEQVFTVVIPSAKRDLFGDSPEKSFRGKGICVTGKIEGDSSMEPSTTRHRAKILIEEEEQIVVRWVDTSRAVLFRKSTIIGACALPT
jgi:hypothetical protein